MREIKFRAWDLKRKEMHSVRDMYFDTRTPQLDYFITKSSQATYHANCESFEIMQYTGLKDKNGVEIYEGDIVKTIKGNVQVVEFLTAYNSKDNKTMVSQFSLKGDKGYYFFDVTDEVIGNIYENLELLEVQND